MCSELLAAVSGKTTLLVRGEEPGKKKTEKAESLGTTILNEQGFFRLVMKRYQRLSRGKSDAPKKALDSRVAESKAKTQKEKITQKQPSGQQNLLWTVKYAPQSIDDIVANKKNVDTLLNWLKVDIQFTAPLFFSERYINESHFSNTELEVELQIVQLG